MEQKDTRPILVSIKCLVYNHEPYLRQCLEGFVMQKTNFRFEAIVHDDASTDKSAAIIREYAEKYPDVIKPIYQTVNQYSQGKGGVGKAITAAMSPDSKYIAICEGDDYWTDPFKLQKQVDFMEANPEYSMIHADVMITDAQGNIVGKKSDKCRYLNLYAEKENLDLFPLIITGEYQIQTLSILFRKSMHDKIPKNDRLFMMGDTPLYLDLVKQGKIKYLPDAIGVYRTNANSITHDRVKNLAFQFSMYDMRVYYCNKYNESVPLMVKKYYNQTLIDNYVFGNRVSYYFQPFKINTLQYFLDVEVLKGGIYSRLYSMIRRHTRRYFEFIKAKIYQRKLKKKNLKYKELLNKI